MASNNFACCLAITLAHEGGFSNHPADPGGPTMRGVTQATYDAWRRGRGLSPRSVRYISDAELQDIYRRAYWDAVHGDRLAPGVDLAVFDYGVNSGPARALKAYAQCAGKPPAEQVKALCAARRAFLGRLKTFSVFGRGWMRRVADIEAKGVKMALAAQPGANVTSRLKAEADKARGAKTASQTGGIAAGGAGLAAQSFGGLDLAAAIAVGIVVAIAIVWCVRRALIHRARADAYVRAALEDGP